MDGEKVKVYIRIENGRVTCICPRWKKRCNRPCEKDVVARDLYAGWEEYARRDRFGR